MQGIDIVDFHLHSKFSIPSSKDMTIQRMVEVAKLKGITILGSGDILLKSWSDMLESTLEFEKGFYYFDGFPIILTGEINLTFERYDRLKMFHIVLAFPDFDAVYEFKKYFKGVNFDTIARPNIKMNPSEFLKKVKAINPDIQMILAHIFTPHFGILGAENNFKSLEEVFEEDVSEDVFLETGLSADPNMVFSVEELRKFVVISSSDAHSPSHIGREATCIKEPSSFKELFENLRERDNLFTLEDFPCLGKYYLDGHRSCKFKTNDFSIEKCPCCGKKLTKGVLHRVVELGGSTNYLSIQKFFNLIPLKDILAKVYKKNEVENVYFSLVNEFENEINVVLFADLDDLGYYLNDSALSTLKSIRENSLDFDCGYDGVYGKWKVLA
jgi:uncharacterized protein (TIGR00375 family)